MRYHQKNTPQTQQGQHSANYKTVKPGVLTTALSISTVLILVAVTFIADWIRTPELTISTFSPFLSPNNGQYHNTVSVNYSISEDADVTVHVVDDMGKLMRTLLTVTPQTAGQYFVTWDGKDDLGKIVPDGQYYLEVNAKASLRTITQSVPLLVDTRVPELQVANLPDGLRVGEEMLTIQGITESDAIVLVDGDPRPIAVDSQGRFSVQYRLNEGSNSFNIQSSDPAGNTAYIAREIILVTQPPDIVLTTPSEGEWFNNQMINVNGQTTSGAMLSINGQAVVADDDGQFQHQLLLNEGDNTIKIEATDDFGNKTFLERAVHLKTQPPSLTLNIQEGETFNNNILHLTGSTEAGTFVKINNQVIPVSVTGNFQLVIDLLEGENIIQIEAQDQAGNTTTLARHINYSIAQPLSGVERMTRNLLELPPYTLPLLISVPLVLAMLFYQQQQISMRLSVAQRSFTPGLPHEGKKLPLFLDLEKSANVTLEILNQRGLTIATLLHNRRRNARKHYFYWDGYNDFGYPVEPGEYTIQAIAGRYPMQVTSAVQVEIKEDLLVHQSGGVERNTMNTLRATSRSTRRTGRSGV